MSQQSNAVCSGPFVVKDATFLPIPVQDILAMKKVRHSKLVQGWMLNVYDKTKILELCLAAVAFKQHTISNIDRPFKKYNIFSGADPVLHGRGLRRF